jgi:hypothetical protein
MPRHARFRQQSAIEIAAADMPPSSRLLSTDAATPGQTKLNAMAILRLFFAPLPENTLRRTQPYFYWSLDIRD